MQPAKSHRKRQMFLAVLLLSLPYVTGCGDSLNRVSMSGTVTYAGQPVEDGMIRFVPKPGTQTPVTIEPIIAGRYSTSSSGGVPAGSYKVAIVAFHPDDPEPKGPMEPPRRQLLPPKYNTQTELEVTIESGQGHIEKNFELQQ